MSGPLLLAAAAITAVWMVSVELAVLLLIAGGIVMAVIAVSRPAPPIIRHAKVSGQRRWGVGLGLGVGPHGPFPFAAIYRRFRR